MAKSTNLYLDDDDVRVLRELAASLRFMYSGDGNLSALMQWMAAIYRNDPDVTRAALQMAYDYGFDDDKWMAFHNMRDYLPPFHLVASDNNNVS